MGLKWTIMRTVRIVFILGIVACLFVFKPTSDHKVENRRHPSPIIILTYMRSGSSFVGDILQQSKDVFYLFEPLRRPQFAIRENKAYNSLNGDHRFYQLFLDAGKDVIRNWTRCNLFDLPNVMWEDEALIRSHKAKILHACRVFESQHQSSNKTLKYCVGKLSEACFQSKHLVVKTIRLPMDTLMSLMEEFPSMKIVYLIRDPRGTFMGRKRIYTKTYVNAERVTDFCSRVYRDLISRDILAKIFPGRILTLFYEDVAKNPLQISKLLFKFTNVEYTSDIEKYVYETTSAGLIKKDCGNLCTIKSNSAAEADRWRSQIDMQTARLIDQGCKPVYKMLGYQEIKSQEMLRNTKIPLRLESKEIDDYRNA